MKRISCILLAIMLLFSFFGCDAQGNPTESSSPETSVPETSTPENVSPFTDEFFADIVEIYKSHTEPVRGDQMEPVIQYLQGLTLIPTDTYLSDKNEEGEVLWGTVVILFRKNNGEELGFYYNDKMLSDAELGSYLVEGGNLEDGLDEAFQQGLQSGGEENAN